MTEQSLQIPTDLLLRDLAPQVVGSRFRDFAAAEDAVQEGAIAASLQWPREGVPDNPRAWLIQVASHAANNSTGTPSFFVDPSSTV